MSLPSLSFPLVSTSGDRVEQMLLQLRKDLRSRGQLPVVIGDAESASRLAEAWNLGSFSFDDALRAATTTEAGDWFRKQMEGDRESFDSLFEAPVYPEGASPITRLQVGFDYNNNPHKEVFIAQIPTTEYWTIPLHLRFGGWNACPDPFVHAMLAKYWEQRYGAKIAVITSDTIEFTVERTPASAEECSELALQQFSYCGDIVDQGVGSVTTLAQALRNSTTWFFWWD